MSAHTPGPWEAISWHVRKVRTGEDMGGWLIASAEGSPLEEKRENVRLIAAAPELLAALERLLTHEQAAGPCDVPGQRCDCVDTARAAIAKARGE